jgi:DtxR family manganese transport transcriptional regulator
MNRFQRTRLDHKSETAEDYLELINILIHEKGEARAVDIAAKLGISQVSVGKTLQRLQKEGLISFQPYRSIFLTERGTKIAQESADRHQLVVRFLLAIGVPSLTAEEDAEGIEHHVSSETLTCMKNFIEKIQSNP